MLEVQSETSKSTSDSDLCSLRQLLHEFEEEGVVDTTIHNHTCERPGASADESTGLFLKCLWNLAISDIFLKVGYSGPGLIQRVVFQGRTSLWSNQRRRLPRSRILPWLLAISFRQWPVSSLVRPPVLHVFPLFLNLMFLVRCSSWWLFVLLPNHGRSWMPALCCQNIGGYHIRSPTRTNFENCSKNNFAPIFSLSSKNSKAQLPQPKNNPRTI